MAFDPKALADALLRGDRDRIFVRDWPDAAVRELMDHVIDNLDRHNRELAGFRTDPTTFGKLDIQRDPNANNSGLYKGVKIVESPRYFDFIETECTKDL